MSDDTHSSSQYVAATLDADIRYNGKPTRAIFIGTTGTLNVVRPDGVSVAWPSIPAGTVLPIAARQINSSGTSATGLMLLY
jgi:hypothetical protein